MAELGGILLFFGGTSLHSALRSPQSAQRRAFFHVSQISFSGSCNFISVAMKVDMFIRASLMPREQGCVLIIYWETHETTLKTDLEPVKNSGTTSKYGSSVMDFGFCSLLLSKIHQSLNMCWRTTAYTSIRKEDDDRVVIILIEIHKQRKSGSDLELKKMHCWGFVEQNWFMWIWFCMCYWCHFMPPNSCKCGQ